MERLHINVEAVAMQVVGTTGQVMMAFDQSNMPNEIQVADFPAGLYLVQVVTEGKEVTVRRFVKE